MLDQPTSFDKLILEGYIKTEVRENVRSGWSSGPDQRSQLKGLRVLVQSVLSDGRVIPVGSTAYIKEESLHTGTVGKNRYKSDTLKGEFIVVHINDVEYTVPPLGDAA